MACFLIWSVWMFNKSWCFLLWGKLSHQTFLFWPFTKCFSHFWACLSAKWLIRDWWILLSFVTLGFPLKSSFNMATNPSGLSCLYTQSRWQYPSPAAEIFFVILDVWCGILLWLDEWSSYSKSLFCHYISHDLWLMPEISNYGIGHETGLCLLWAI